MRKKLLAVATVGLLAAATMTACDDSNKSGDTSGGSDSGTGSGQARVGIILPDTESSTRWKNDDPKYLKAAFDSQHIPVEIKNALGDKANFVKIATDMLNSGVKVLMIANLDSDTGKEVLDKAKQKKIPTIDYDRLTLNGGADYYVSFDNVKVGTLQATGLINCLRDKNAVNPIVAEVNGSPTDNNATLFKKGYDDLLNPLYDKASFTKGPDQSVPDWNNDEGGRIFAQMLSQQPKIAGVLAANDGLAGAVIKVLQSKGMAGRVPVTGQDATVPGLQAVLAGEQCMTVYKPLRPEAERAADLAIALYKGERPTVKDQIKDPESGAYVPFALLEPQPITADSVKVVVNDKFVSKKDLCTGRYAALCVQYGIV
ncbi:substrate-binding domain-containing protein [Actinoplanes sp. KI2]|uniref:sugar ABC transporter substrate-binding protein n=1 Tax=Actinoplanes sp. KI2 TaxID=2983315 RepID=UPI0021D5C8EB|nr:substrate-binding domain-containing protein [Actinoplanes sp. KI2]MCU7730206.1 substrate-binding domain-containing protein [Actinoplanes sp. KI2]